MLVHMPAPLQDALCLVPAFLWASLPAYLLHTTCLSFLSSYLCLWLKSGIFLAVSGCLWAEPLLSPHLLFFLILTKAVSPALQSCSFFSDLQREEREVSSRKHGGQGWASLVLPHLPGFSLPLLNGTPHATHPHSCPPHCCFQGDQDSAWSTLPVHKRLRLAGSQLLTTAILPRSPNRASHSTLLGMLCSSKGINWTFLNSGVVWPAFQHVPVYTKFWPAVLICQSRMGFWHTVKHDLFEPALSVDKPGWVVWKCGDLSWSDLSWSSKVCVVLSASSLCPLRSSLSSNAEFSEGHDWCVPSSTYALSQRTVINLLKAATSVFQNVFSNPYHEEQHRRGTRFPCWRPKVKENLRLDPTQVIAAPKVMPNFHLCQPFIAVGASSLCRTRNFFRNCLTS